MGITYGDHLIDSGYYDITPEQERETECCDLAAKVPCADCPQAGVSKICLTKFEEILLRAAKSGLNYIANTEAELGITLESGDLLREAIGRIDSYIDGGRSSLAQSEDASRKRGE